MKHYFKLLLIMVLSLIPASQVFSARSYSKYVGQSVVIEWPNWYGGRLDKIVTPSSNAYLSFTKDDVSATVTVISYFEGSLTFDIQFTESWWSKGYLKHQTYSLQYKISCMLPSIKVENEMSLMVGETKKIEQVITPNNITVPMYWGFVDLEYQSSLNASITSDGYVTGKKAGTAIALALPYGQQSLARTCTITIKDDETTAITNMDFNNDHVFYYSIAGKKSTNPHKGLNIIRTSDGKTKKVIKE